MRAQRPRRFGTTASNRPPDASTRQTSRSSAVGVLRHFQRMHQQHAIDRGVGQRQFELVDQRRQRRPRGRPFHHALRRRHEGEAALGLLAEQPEIGRGVADAEDAHVRAYRSSARRMPRPTKWRATDAEPLGVEIAQIDDVDGHGGIVSTNATNLPRRSRADVGFGYGYGSRA